MLRRIGRTQKYELYFEEWRRLQKAQYPYLVDKTNYKKRKEYFESTLSFFNWYLNYANNALKDKKYTDTHIAQQIFKLRIKTDSEWIQYLYASLFVSAEYVKYLKDTITVKNIGPHHHTISSLRIDLEWLIASFEIRVSKKVKFIQLKSGRRKNLSPSDLYSAARQIFYIESFTKLEDLYLRDLKPVVIFQIRQLIEIFGKDLIGYNNILDNNGNPIKKFTQISWEFIKEEAKKATPKIKFPFDIHIILAINTWANAFVHSTHIYNSYIQHHALKTVGLLFRSSGNRIRTYTGKWSTMFDCADIEIVRYKLLKQQFRRYIVKRMPNARIDWMETKDVTAYIISL